MGKQMFSYHAKDLLRDIPQHLKDLIFLSKEIKRYHVAVRSIHESNRNRNLLLTITLLCY